MASTSAKKRSLWQLPDLEDHDTPSSELMNIVQAELCHRIWFLSFHSSNLEHEYIYSGNRFSSGFMKVYLLLAYSFFMLSLIGLMTFWPNHNQLPDTYIRYPAIIIFLTIFTSSIIINHYLPKEPHQQISSLIACIICISMVSNISFYFTTTSIAIYTICLSIGVCCYIATLNRQRGYYIYVCFGSTLAINIMFMLYFREHPLIDLYVLPNIITPIFAGMISLYQDSIARYRFLTQAMMRVQQLTLQESNKKLATLANIDHLSALDNRRSFEKQLIYEWNRSARSQSPVSLMIIDIDCFKLYNDLYGHVQGDHIIRFVAEQIRKNVNRSLDFCARYGGEEYVVILPHTNQNEALKLAQRICASIYQTQTEHTASEISPYLTVSVGVATQQGDHNMDHANTLVQFADEALYQAKNQGKNCVASYTQPADAAV